VCSSDLLVQGLQLIHLQRFPDLLVPNTLNALEGLKAHGLVSGEDAASLTQDYITLRKVEHFLQLFGDRQVHELPTNDRELLSLARKILGRTVTPAEFLAYLKLCFDRVRGIHARIFNPANE
jgi:[glutamine synthetase] adenylyltransferase / [glutamine synthetase]-adenylyl-L-tyrosine phosphorylase